MGEVAHDERVIKRDTAHGECRLVGEESRLDMLDCEWTYFPIVSLKPHAVEAAIIASDGVANAAALEVGRRLRQ
jgi:hypothetical protein